MTDKYLVFRLERPLYEDEPHRVQVVIPCFELVKEFKVKNWDDDFSSQVAYGFAEQYSSDNGVRVLVIRGTVFG